MKSIAVNTNKSNKLMNKILNPATIKCCNIVLKYSVEEAFNPYLNTLYGSYQIHVSNVEHIVPNNIPATPKSKITKKYI